MCPQQNILNATGHGQPLTPAAVTALLQDPCPRQDGLWVVDVATGAPRLLASHARVLEAVVHSERGLDPLTGSRMPVQGGLPEGVAACWHWMDKPIVRTCVCCGCTVGVLYCGCTVGVLWLYCGCTVLWSQSCTSEDDHAQANREATSVVFEYHISNCSGSDQQWSYLFVVDMDGGLWRVPLLPTVRG